ncbi:MAG: 50S ribosomal protein L18 [Parcubacteria group bacterium GW2011_GWA2_42_11]|nr:MAG: 50S ribosomal protein L18 [Parcubacteria group bacterium GW2011_GWA2_42_11]
MSDIFEQKRISKQKRANRTRAKIFGTSERPRLCVFRSNKHLYVQIINDQIQKTLVSASDLDLKKKVVGVEAAKSVFRQPPVGTIVVYKVAGLPPYNQGTQIRFAEVGARGLTTSPKVLAQSQFSGLTLSEIAKKRQ